MSRWSPVLFFLLLFPLWPASASAQNLLAPPKVYFALVGSARDARQHALIKSLVEDIRRNLRTSANAAERVDELQKWTADDAPNLVPKEYNRYVVALVEEKYQSGLGMATMVTFEVGRLESTETGRKLAFAGIPQEGLDVIVAPPPPDERKPAEFTKYNGGWQFRPNSQIASEVIPWIKAVLPELQPPYTFYLVCSDAKRTWTVADILSSESDLNGTVSAFLRKLTQNLEAHAWKPPWQSVVADMQGPTALTCGSQDRTLRERAHFILRGSLADDMADSAGTQVRGVAVKLYVEDQTAARSYATASAPMNAPRSSDDFYARKSDAGLLAELESVCADDIGVLTKNTKFADSVARSIRVKVYPPKDGSFDASWRCRKPER